MNRFFRILSFASLVVATGCLHTRYRVYVYNGTSEKITEARITVKTGESFSFGTLGSQVDAGIWPVRGPLGKEAFVEWTDANKAKKSAKTRVSIGPSEDSVIFLINSNDSVTVQTGRQLYGYRKRDLGTGR